MSRLGKKGSHWSNGPTAQKSVHHNNDMNFKKLVDFCNLWLELNNPINFWSFLSTSKTGLFLVFSLSGRLGRCGRLTQ